MYFYNLNTCLGAILLAKEVVNKLIIDGKKAILMRYKMQFIYYVFLLFTIFYEHS